MGKSLFDGVSPVLRVRELPLLLKRRALSRMYASSRLGRLLTAALQYTPRRALVAQGLATSFPLSIPPWFARLCMTYHGGWELDKGIKWYALVCVRHANPDS